MRRVVKLCFPVLCSVEVSFASALGVDLRWMSAGASFTVWSSANVPFNTETSLDLANEELQIKFLMPNTVSQRSVITFLNTFNDLISLEAEDYDNNDDAFYILFDVFVVLSY